MKRRKNLRLLGGLLAAVLLFLSASRAQEITWQLNGADYVASRPMVQKLDAVLSGGAVLFSNTAQTFRVGDAILTESYYTVGEGDQKIWGMQCYIYANAVYSYLFDDIPYHGDAWDSRLAHSSIVLKNQPAASYELFRNAGVGFGSYLRTTANADGSYHTSEGHSLIILDYDESGITYLDCNYKRFWSQGQQYSKICAWRTGWAEFNAMQQLTAEGGRRINEVITANAYVGVHGKPQPHTPGDVNGDGVIDMRDGLTLMKLVQGESVPHISTATDINGDGWTGDADVQLLLRYLAGENLLIY